MSQVNMGKKSTIETVRETCTGCRVCEKVCPVHCIRIEPDEDGFLYPVIQKETCISCGKCLEQCHLTKAAVPAPAVEVGRYGHAKKDSLRREGSSGGAFSALVEAVAEGNPGERLSVFGSVFDVGEQTVHQQGFAYPDYKALCQSKYVFSDPRDTFVEVKECLDAGNRVIYCGTPCQIGGLRQYLGEAESENLITVDFICHGVPSAGFLENHLHWILKGKPARNVEFRSKAMGWKTYCLKITKQNGVYLKKAGQDFYFAHFFMNDSLRSGCYACHYSGANVSDLTLGDFWEKHRYAVEESDVKGVSVLFANTQKGQRLLRELERTMELKPLPPGYRRSGCGCSQQQYPLQKAFLKQLREQGIGTMERRFLLGKPLRVVKKWMKKVSG